MVFPKVKALIFTDNTKTNKTLILKKRRGPEDGQLQIRTDWIRGRNPSSPAHCKPYKSGRKTFIYMLRFHHCLTYSVLTKTAIYNSKFRLSTKHKSEKKKKSLSHHLSQKVTRRMSFIKSRKQTKKTKTPRREEKRISRLMAKVPPVFKSIPDSKSVPKHRLPPKIQLRFNILRQVQMPSSQD